MDMSVYDLLVNLRKRDKHRKGHTSWRNLLARLQEPGDPLLAEFNGGKTVYTHDTQSRWRDQRSSLERLDWGKDLLRKEVLALEGLDLYSTWDPSEPKAFLNTSMEEQ